VNYLQESIHQYTLRTIHAAYVSILQLEVCDEFAVNTRS